MRIIYIIVGFISFMLGTIGIFLPVLPTVPLYLLAVFCFAKSSEKLHDLIINSELYNKHVKDYTDKKGLTKAKKIKTIIFSTTVMTISTLLCPNIFGKIIIIICLLIHILMFIFYIPTKKE